MKNVSAMDKLTFGILSFNFQNWLTCEWLVFQGILVLKNCESTYPWIGLFIGIYGIYGYFKNITVYMHG